MELKKCPYCGKAVLATSKSCKHCGKSFEEEEARRDEARKVEGTKARKDEARKVEGTKARRDEARRDEQPFVEQQETEIQQNIVDAPEPLDPPEQTEKAGIETTCWMWLLCTILLIINPILGLLGVIGLIAAANYKRIQVLINQK
jgi:hypothetical protein